MSCRATHSKWRMEPHKQQCMCHVSRLNFHGVERVHERSMGSVECQHVSHLDQPGEESARVHESAIFMHDGV